MYRFTNLFSWLFLLSLLILFSGCFLKETKISNESGKFLSIDEDTKLHYRRAGNGAAIVLVPGWSFSGNIFLQQISYFSKNHDVIAIDPRGQGDSTKSAEGNSYLQHGEDIAAVLKMLRLENVNFIGWSWGCYDILSYVRQFGTTEIARFICLDEPPRGWSNEASDWAEVFSLESFAGLYHAVAGDRKAFTDDFAKSMVTRPLTGQELQSLVSMSLQTPDHIAVALAVDGMLSDYSEEAILLAKAVPSLYIVREDSQEVAIQWIAENMPNAQTFIKGGHLMFWEFPDEINTVIDQFLNQTH